MDPNDEIARLRADGDQAKEGMKELAGTTWAFYAALTDEGFAPDEALALTAAWITALAGGGR